MLGANSNPTHPINPIFSDKLATPNTSSSSSLFTSSSSFQFHSNNKVEPTITNVTEFQTSSTIPNSVPPTTSHFQDASDYINHELVLLGLPSPLVLFNASTLDASNTLNVIFMLLQQVQKDKLHRKEIDARYQKLSTDYSALEVQLQRHKDKINAAERENRDTYAKLSKTESQLKESQEKCKVHTDELKLVKSSYQKIKSQFMHEKRKWERTHATLQQKLVHPKPTNPSFTVSHIQPYLVNHAEKDSFYHQLLQTSEAREQSLSSELITIKQCMYQVWVDLESLHSSQPYATFELVPFEYVQEQLEHRFMESIQKLRDRLLPQQDLEKLNLQVLELAKEMEMHHGKLGHFIQHSHGSHAETRTEHENLLQIGDPPVSMDVEVDLVDKKVNYS